MHACGGKKKVCRQPGGSVVSLGAAAGLGSSIAGVACGSGVGAT